MVYRKLVMAALAATALTGVPAMAETKAPAAIQATENDPYLWLEEVEGAKAIDWAKQHNETSFSRLKTDPRFEPLRADAEKILTARDRIAYGSLEGGKVDNFWQDQTNVRGVWRRTTVDGYRKPDTQWDVILDIDALAKAENENWVYKGHNCLPPAGTRCLVNLSRGGKDAVVVREYDVEKKAWVKDGFQLPESKQTVDWADADTLMVATDFGPDTMTDSGYARQVRLWKRGTDLAKAPIVLNVAKTDVWGRPLAIHRPEGTTLLLNRGPDFFTEEWSLLGKDGKVTKLPLPQAIELNGMLDGQLLIGLRDDWSVVGKTFTKGSLVAVPLAELAAGAVKTVSTVYAPSETAAIQQVRVAQDAVYLGVLDNVVGKLLQAKPAPKGGGWSVATVEMPANGAVSIVSTDAYSRDVLVNYNSYLVPDTLYLMAGGAKPEAIKSLPARFDAAPFTTEQRFATSKDGTKVPYFIVHAKSMALTGDNPTLLYGYGGFEIAMTPGYLGPLAKSWLQDGGVYVVANIRGGGEFGPRWHQAALKENRQRAFDDFAAVAEDLIKTKVTRPARLGIQGGSNGGLLTGTVMTQRPDLLGAAIVAVPLLDMLRYHKLLAGASWMGEYGNPDIPAERAWIEKYSPYQNVRKDVTYPEAFVYTSTKDDRVHPGHARKFVARLEEQGHPVIYFENIEGGHSAAANLKQRAEVTALQGIYLRQQLIDKPGKASN
ncbi:prolyl oligopeptidase family serine peptidase [Oleisolibacter albus]|uniref:prolyl oligopeptidase family serine peptidase n=1 Tax=Oleisolibacter albus TaxID=2171757 RepID=UPI000DF424C7|nr:prolyl oligopeptidase family serine peptidase [Oleisolibacter albus]